eukprot:RCo014610
MDTSPDAGLKNNAYIRVLVCSFLDFKDLCMVELVDENWRNSVLQAGDGELWRLLFKAYFPTVEDCPSSSTAEGLSTWKAVFGHHYRWQVCKYTGERFERTRNSAHSITLETIYGKKEGWHVSTLCPEDLDPNTQRRPEEFALSMIQGPRRGEFLFYFPAVCCPIVASYDGLAQAIQDAYDDIVQEGCADDDAFYRSARSAYPRYADVLVEMRSSGQPCARKLFSQMPLPRVKRMLASRNL